MLETFVEHGRFQATGYRAANWIHIGMTKGRGRQDVANKHGVELKDIYVYPLREDAVEILSNGSVVYKPISLFVPEDWVEKELGEAKLDDCRMRNRLLVITRDMYARPQASIPQACQSRAKTKAAYRFFEDNDNTMDKILAPHYESTVKRISKEKVILAVQDTTSLNYTTHRATEKLGPIGSKKDGAIGLLVHDTMAFNLESTPLGLLNVQCWARDKEKFGKKQSQRKLSIEEKESYNWLKSFKVAVDVQKRCPETMVVSVGDREADIYELFELALRDSRGPKLLIRAKHNRLMAEGQGHLWDYVGEQALSGIQKVCIPRKKNHPAREASLEIRFARVNLKPPKNGKKELGELTLWGTIAEEVNYEDSVEEPVRWLLLTTLEVASFEEAVEKLEWYVKRWGIEVYHKTLKSGCKVEERQLRNADRIESCLAIDMIVAWRIFHLSKLGREIPDVPCSVFFEEAEWKALVVYKTKNPISPEKPPTLKEAIHMVANLGGFLDRKGDGEPGTKTLWLGLQRLEDITEMWKVLSTHINSPPCVQ